MLEEDGHRQIDPQLLAELYLREKRDADAAATYASLEESLPRNPTILNNLAWSLKDSNPEKGLEYARQANEIAPSNPLIMDTLAMLLLKTGDSKQALEVVRRAADIAPQVGEIQLNLAEILAANGKKDEARKVLENLLENVNQEQAKQIIRDRIESL